jgi:hypothetical protein
LVKHGKKRIRFGSKEKKTLDFVDPNKDPKSYIKRYLTEEDYKDWFNRNYPNDTIYGAVGLSESDYAEIKNKLANENDDISIEKTEPEPEPKSDSDEWITGKWTSKPNQKDKTPPTDPEETFTTDAETKNIKKKDTKLFWLRVVFSIMGGVAATFLFEGIEHDEEHRWTSIGFMIILFLVTCVIAKGMKIKYPRSDRKKIVTTGIGSFIFLYLFAWIMSFTLLNLPQENISIIPGL